MRRHACAALTAFLALGLGPALACGGSGSAPPGTAPQPLERSGAGATSVGPLTKTALPPDLPESLEIEARRRTEDGEDRVLKLTPAGTRYGLSHGKARIALRYRLEEGALESVWATLRQEGFDRLQTVTRAGSAALGGTSLRVATGSDTYTVGAMGRQAPATADAEAHARCLAAVERLLPNGRSDVVVHLVWDASMKDRSAGLDVDVGNDLVGLHRVPVDRSGGEAPVDAFELHLASASAAAAT